MGYGPQQLADSFRTVRKNTIVIAEEIPAEKYEFVAAPGVKSVAEMLSHLAVSPRWQMALHTEGLTHVDFAIYSARIAQAKADEAALKTKDEIVAALKDGAERFAAFAAGLSQDTLDEIVSFPPPVQPSQRSRLEMLMGVKEHEMHHRAQLMLIERMIGIVPHITRQREAAVAARS